MERVFASVALASILAGSSGCWYARIHHTLEPVDDSVLAACSASAPSGRGEEIVGIALSGGGSRAAVFGAASLEALWEHGLIDLVTHVSSVSGGSIASSYFIANRPACDAGASPAEAEACWRDFFAEFKMDMRTNYWGGMERRQLTRFRWFSNTKRASSLQETMDDRFLDGVTFGDLLTRDAAARESGRSAPALLINASSFDDSRRFVFSNICLPEKPVFDGDEIDANPLNRAELRALTFSRPGCGRPTPPDMPLSMAVATSASFPGIGPVSIDVPSACEGGDREYWHLGDGGIFDNSGVDTLEEVVLRERQGDASALERALILSVHSGMRAKPSRLRLIRNFWLYTYHPELLFEISSQRGQAYHDLVWERLEADLKQTGIEFEKIELRYTAAEVDHWPESCPQASENEDGKQSPEAVRAAIAEYLSDIPTRLSIKDCDADLLELAAHSVVHAQLAPEVMQRLRTKGFAVRTGRIID